MKLYHIFFPLLVSQVNALQFIKNQQGCIDPASFDSSADYFPEKVTPTASLFWDIEYFKSYKVLRNEIAGESFLLYQCGTELPASIDRSNYTYVLPVPLPNGVALESTTHIPHFEMLGLRTQIKAWMGYPDYISSPCVNQMISDGSIIVVQDTSSKSDVDDLLDTIGPDLVSFVYFRGSYNSALTNITISESSEASNEAIFEWNKFFSVFFNAEAKSNALFAESSSRYACVAAEAAQTVTADSTRKTVLWAAYTNYSGVDGWSIGTCPNYYCEYAEKCSVDLVTSRDGTIDYFGSLLFTTEDFVAIAKDAEYWIYSGPNWDEAYGLYGSQLDEFVSVKAKKVFDTENAGDNAWFEQRLADYDIVLQDFCSAVGTTNTIHKRVWLRDIFTEDVDNITAVCTDVTAVPVSRATTCGDGSDAASDAVPMMRVSPMSLTMAALLLVTAFIY